MVDEKWNGRVSNATCRHAFATRQFRNNAYKLACLMLTQLALLPYEYVPCSFQ